MVYLIHMLVFAVLTIVTFVVDPSSAVCPKDPENPAAGDEDYGMVITMLMLGGYGYMGCTGLSLFVFVLIKYFSGSFLPGEFGSLGKLKSCGGLLLRIFMQLLTFAHWILLAPNAIFLLTYGTASECFMNAMGTQAIVFLMLPLFWVLQHIGGAVARTFIDIPTFLTIPEVAGGSIFQTLCVTCGP